MQSSFLAPLVSAAILIARKIIPNEIYKEAHNYLPISTVDFVPTRINNGVREFLLCRRAEEPFKGTWFVTGGRQNYGERMLAALQRQAKRELELDVFAPGVAVIFRGIIDVLNPASESRPEWHSVWHLHEVALPEGFAEFEAAAENEALNWFSHIQPEFPEPVKVALFLMAFPEA